MADRIELFERRNRLRIVALVVLATLNYIVAVVMAAIALGIGIALAIIFQGDAFTRNPTSLIHALEKLDADASGIRHVSRATGPLWLEFPAHVLGSSSSRTTRRLARELLLDERIDLLRELAGQPSRPVTR